MSVRVEVLPFIGRALIAALLIVTIAGLTGARWKTAAWIGAALFVAVSGALLFFFRDPERRPPDDSRLILAGADGTVLDVTVSEKGEWFPDGEICISTFLSLLNVHVNRVPLSGTVMRVTHTVGHRKMAWKKEASDENERNTVEIKGDVDGVVKQIVGFAARRVGCWVKPGHEVERGERFGLMKFGSRLDVYLPADKVEPLVAAGDKTRAGETAIARIK